MSLARAGAAPIGVGVIGAGILGSRHARVFSQLPGARCVAVADPDETRATTVATRHGARSFTDYREMIGALGPAGTGELHAVAVATPDFLHREPVGDALDAGLDVLVEKPLAMLPSDARAMVRLASERERVLMVNYSQRWLPEHRKIETLLHDGTLGAPAFIESHRWDAAWVPERMISWAARTTPIHFMSSHDIDLILHWIGGRVESVTAVAHRGALTETRGLAETVDGYVALLRFRSGAVVSLHSSWILPDSFPSAADASLQLLGSRGSVWLDTNAREMRLFTERHSERLTFGGPVTATEVNGRLEGAFTESLRAFLTAVRTRELDAPTSALRTLHVVDVQDAIMRAADSGSIVSLAEDGAGDDAERAAPAVR
jgi:predicted dehydrogenase